MPLRVKLVGLVLLLLAAALALTGIPGTYSLRDYLVDRTDAQLDRSTRRALQDCRGRQFQGWERSGRGRDPPS